MTGNLFLDAAAMAVSIFNTILLVWLGLTVLFNSDRRAWGIWLGGLGLLMGGAFFVSHSAILHLGLHVFGWNMLFWWAVGLVPAITLPFLWYLVVLWYAGFWEERPSPLYRRQHNWLRLTITLVTAGLAGLALGIFLLMTPPWEFVQLRLFLRWSVWGVPLLAVGYAVYVVLCIALSLDALSRPGPVRRVMGAAARQRARPWFTAVSITLLLVSLLTIGVMGWVVQDARQRPFYEIFDAATMTIAVLDLIIASLIALSVVLLGQAVVSYEVFTGKTLPRRGLWRQWRRTIFLAAGYSLVVGGSLFLDLRPIYSLLLTALLIAFFFALFSWRSYRERERYIDNLRPFLTSQRLTDQLLTPSGPAEVNIALPFHALCTDVLDARLAYLTAVGPLAPLVGTALVYPINNRRSLPPLTDLSYQFRNTQTPIAINPVDYGGAVWAVPLWSERGLIGIFLLGPKWGNGLYTQEEIDVARVSGERLIDTKASAEMARRLMALQRERLAQTQIVDQQTRRVLHDDILPEIQMAIIALSGETAANGVVADAVNTLSSAHRQISNLLREMPTTKAPEVARLGLIGALQQTIELEFASAFDEVVWQISPEAIENTSTIPTLTAEVIFYAAREAVRNAAKYGRGEGQHALGERPFHLHITIYWQNGLHLQIEDNGIGLVPDAQPQGSGQGLALHTTMMAVIGGELTTESVPGQFTRVTLLVN
ncbi:MAG: hypothetical protein H6662_18710 [Ardenticatenaceae bacterium]|nr:hypothetical protein [Anaerolineales bacterium]MCB8923623.1 hypothetical protein [Ardenticatenaceae bacterium]MCB8991842.1 hypothetical protein [Ardenticatenaceae bacterium]